MTRLFPSLICGAVLSFLSCSSGVTIRATRLAGVVIDGSIVVEVGTIWGDPSGKFRDELLDGVRSRPEFTSPSSLSTNELAHLLIEGTYSQSSEEHTQDEQEGDKTVKYRLTTYRSLFEYSITDTVSRELVSDGQIEENSVDKDKDESKGFAEAIVNAIFGGIVKAIFYGDEYASLRRNVIRRFIGEISPHELRVEVVLFEDSEIPELKQGIGLARIGKWKDAADVFLNAIERHPGHKNLHKAYYNAGVAYEYDHQYRFALEYLEKAFRMSAEEDYAGELQRCERYQREYNWREGYLEKLRLGKSSK